MIKLKDDVKLETLEKYGFVIEDGKCHLIRTTSEGVPIYTLYVTQNHRFIQARVWIPCSLAGKIQDIIFDLTLDGLVEKN